MDEGVNVLCFWERCGTPAPTSCDSKSVKWLSIEQFRAQGGLEDMVSSGGWVMRQVCERGPAGAESSTAFPALQQAE